MSDDMRFVVYLLVALILQLIVLMTSQVLYDKQCIGRQDYIGVGSCVSWLWPICLIGVCIILPAWTFISLCRFLFRIKL